MTNIIDMARKHLCRKRIDADASNTKEGEKTTIEEPPKDLEEANDKPDADPEDITKETRDSPEPGCKKTKYGPLARLVDNHPRVTAGIITGAFRSTKSLSPLLDLYLELGFVVLADITESGFRLHRAGIYYANQPTTNQHEHYGNDKNNRFAHITDLLPCIHALYSTNAHTSIPTVIVQPTTAHTTVITFTLRHSNRRNCCFCWSRAAFFI